MVRFYSKDLKMNLIECIEYIISTPQKNMVHIYSDDLKIENYSLEEDLAFFDMIEYMGDEYNDSQIHNSILGDGEETEIIINSDTELEIYFYTDADLSINLTVADLIDYVNKSKSSSFDEKGVCISNKEIIFRVAPDNPSYNNTLFFPPFHKNLKYKNKCYSAKVTTKNTFYSLMLYFNGYVDEYNCVELLDDLFVEIESNENLEIKKEVSYEIYNAYIFEIFASHDVKLNLNPRVKITINEETSLKGISEKDILKLRPLLFGKGLKDIIALFNDAESYGIDNRSIIEYIKVIEYVSQTVIRLEITESARKKLNSEEALNPTANYIRELENMFLEYNKQYSADRNSIKATILKCCDINLLTKYSPKFLKKMSNLTKNLSNPKSNKTDLLREAYNELCDSISDTRNELSHAKANYSPNGNECPSDEKKDFVILLKHICVQVIRWFSNVNELDRIVNDSKP